jgi:FAD synthase
MSEETADIRGTVFRGLGLASKLDFPTVNIKNENKTPSGIYLVEHKEYGKGVAFVLRRICEIHFFKRIEFEGQYLSCDLIQKINPPQTGGILDVFYNGITVTEKTT